MSNNDVSLLKDQIKKFENAFTDNSYLVNPLNKNKNQDILWREQEEQKRKKRYLASTLLNQSMNSKNVFEMWYQLHDRQFYD